MGGSTPLHATSVHSQCPHYACQPPTVQWLPHTANMSHALYSYGSLYSGLYGSCLSVHGSILLSVPLFVHLSACLSVCLFTCSSFCLSVCICWSVFCWSVCVCVARAILATTICCTQRTTSCPSLSACEESVSCQHMH